MTQPHDTYNPVILATSNATWTFPVYTLRIEVEFLMVAFLLLILAASVFGLQNVLLHISTVLTWLADAVGTTARKIHEFQVNGFESKTEPQPRVRPTPGKPIHIGPVGRLWRKLTDVFQPRREED